MFQRMTRRRRLCPRKFHTSKGPGVGLTAPGPALSWTPGGAFEERQESIARAAVSFPTVAASVAWQPQLPGKAAVRDLRSPGRERGKSPRTCAIAKDTQPGAPRCAR